MFALGLLIGILIGIGISNLINLAVKESLDGWGSSCTGECNQGRNCNCVEIKK
jgi:hypothetical protein